MRIGGLQKFTLIDYPGKVACILFTQGCNFRCGYCHNPELVIPEKFCPAISEESVFKFLQERREYLQGVVVSGGEPTIHGDLLDFIRKIKQIGYAVKLDTNGSQPHMLNRLIQEKLVDFIAMDVKAPLDKYEEVAGVSINADKIKESIELIMRSGIEYQFRTTVMKAFCSAQDIREIRQMIKGSSCYLLQKGRLNEKILDKSLLAQKQYSDLDFENLIYDLKL